LDIRLREGGDAGTPLVLSGETAAAQALKGIAGKLTAKPRGLAGMPLGIQPR
jgi:ATP-binding protein involved in chromosome partitioning